MWQSVIVFAVDAATTGHSSMPKKVTFPRIGTTSCEATICRSSGFFPMYLKTDSMRFVSQTLSHQPCPGSTIALTSHVPLPGGYAPKSDF